MSHALSSLERFASLSASMAQAASAQEWETVVQLGQERGALLAAMPENLASHLLPAEQAHARHLIDSSRQLDTQTMALLGERQNELRVLLREPMLAPSPE